MTLKDTLTDTIKTAMKARELEKVKILRNVQAVIKQIEIDRQVTLNDADVLDILQKQIKQRQESLTVFENNNRDDLAQKERFEIDVISTFLPEALSDSELADIVNSTIARLNATTMADMGKVMNDVKAQTVGRADPAVISRLVKLALAV